MLRLDIFSPALSPLFISERESLTQPEALQSCQAGWSVNFRGLPVSFQPHPLKHTHTPSLLPSIELCTQTISSTLGGFWRSELDWSSCMHAKYFVVKLSHLPAPLILVNGQLRGGSNVSSSLHTLPHSCLLAYLTHGRVFSRQGLPMQLRLPWNSRCRPEQP